MPHNVKFRIFWKLPTISQKVALSNYKEDHATLSDEMTAVLNYLDKSAARSERCRCSLGAAIAKAAALPPPGGLLLGACKGRLGFLVKIGDNAICSARA